MERFCESGNDASRIEELQSAVRNGSRSSMTSWRRNVGTGSSSQDFGGEERISRRSSVLEISYIDTYIDYICGPTLYNFLPAELTTACHFQAQLKRHFMESLCV